VTLGLVPKWTEALSLSRRNAPELYTTEAEVEPGSHMEAIRFALSDLGLTAVFCIEGVPTIGFVNEPDVSLERIDELHRILWNQGLLSLLLVIRDDELNAYSLVRRPFRREHRPGTDPRLVTTLSLVSDSLKLRELIDSTESGRFWFEHDEFFNPDDRVDNVLLSNLLQAFREMRDELGSDAAQALLMQTMFIAYLEDRKIIKADVFRNASATACSSLADMLAARSPAPFESLFIWLKDAFNGNMFNAPCAFEIGDRKPPRLKAHHLKVLARFRHGREEMASGQLRLWGYDFRYMPIGLISAVYDRFLKEEAEKKSADGAFYTPMFLADMVVNQLWDELSDEQRASGVYCDPACGSGIFLVRLFQRLVAFHCRTKNKRRATWNDLKAIASRLHGGDLNPSAVRVAAFSLYIALVEQSDPPDLQALIKDGKVLPSLYGDTLQPAEDFFDTEDGAHFDAIVGNPPWKGRTGQVTTAQIWAKAQGYPDPAKEIAWGFVWKALKVIKPAGLVAFLLPAMGVLHNTSRESQTARRLLLRNARIRRIINLSDLCFQLFDGAQRPTAFVLYEQAKQGQTPYRFEYWVPKADLNLRLKRMMTLSRSDRIRFRSDLVDQDPTILKRRLWTRAPEEKLLQFLRTSPSLSAFISEYKDVRNRVFNRQIHWAIGQGFQPAQEGQLQQNNYRTTMAPIITRYPYLRSDEFRTVALATIRGSPWPTSSVRRAGFAEGFLGPHILIRQGIERSIGRVRAAYSEQSLVFEHSIQAIAFPESKRHTAKLLTAVLNSSLAAWVYFHDTANFGTDRAKVHQGDLLKLPFDLPKNMPDSDRAVAAEEKIVRLVDIEIKHADDILRQKDDVLQEIDELVFAYYGLDAHDIAIVEDTFRYIIPAMQPRRSAGLQEIWANSRPEHRSEYASILCDALKPWLREPINASLAAKSSDIAVLQLTINGKPQDYSEQVSSELDQFLQSVKTNLPVSLPGNVQLIPDLRFVIGRDMYLVKPMQLRHWLRSTALADAEQIAAEFSAALARDGKHGGEHAGG
jgi:N-6 DNA Methylase